MGKKATLEQGEHTVRLVVGRASSADAVNLVENQVKRGQRMTMAI